VNVLVFDIETVPDVAGGRRLLGVEDLDDDAIAKAMFQQRRQATGSEFLRHHLQRVVAISVALRRPDGKFTIRSVGEVESDEADLLSRFFKGLERYSPTLVSWNGSGFDLPVLHYRALIHGISAPRYWDVGDEQRDFRYNNYLGRFHWRHIDLMDVLAGYQFRAAAPLDEIAQLLGFPGKLGMHGARVWEELQSGNIQSIRNYCDTDVLNTFLVYLRFELMRGRLTHATYASECARVRDTLAAGAPHLSEFLEAWDGTEESLRQ